MNERGDPRCHHRRKPARAVTTSVATQPINGSESLTSARLRRESPGSGRPSARRDSPRVGVGSALTGSGYEASRHRRGNSASMSA